MTAVFLIIWFYVYVGLQFGMVSNNVGLFPRTGSFWQVVGWPVFLCIYLFNRMKDSNFGWFVRYIAYKVTH
jgi:hypothetical protein